MAKIWFHGTQKEEAAEIMCDGFKPNSWFAACLEDAIAYGGPCIFEVALDIPKHNWRVTIREPVPQEFIVALNVFSVENVVDFTDRRDYFKEVHKDGSIDGFAGKYEPHKWN